MPEDLASGKRRSFAQRVGHGGELAFRIFAARHGLLPTKIEEDYGIDFTFQVDLDHNSRHSSDIANTFAGACVRATQSADGKVNLTRGDAANLLNSRSPLVFALVHLADLPDTATHHHRLVDDAFMAELQTFLDGDTKTVSVGPTDCSTEDDFGESLATLLSYGFTERVRLAVATAGINSVLPHATVEIRRSPDGQLTLVSNVEFFSLFEQFNESQEREVLRVAFGVDDHLVERLAGLNPRPDIMKYLRNLPQPTYLGGFTTQAEVVLEVERGEERASAPFTYRRIGTHYAYVHQCGLSLIISHARERGGVMIHETEVAVDALVDSVLEDLGTLLDFLELCGEDAVIREVSHDESVRHRFEVAQLFQPLHTIAAFVASWRICAMIEGWPERCVALNDVADPEVFYTLSGFARLVEQPDFIAAASFFLDRVTNPILREELTEAQTTAYAPFIGNLAGATVVLRLSASAMTLALDGEVRGIRFKNVEAGTCEVRELVAKTTIYPELAIGGNAPTFALAPARPEGVLPSSLSDLAITWEEGTDLPAADD